MLIFIYGKPMERLNWDDLRLFLAVAHEGTLTGAARATGLGLATVSRRIERMEQVLRLPLFLHHQFGYALTDQGRALLPRAEAVELAMHEMRQAAGEQVRISGLVRMACFETLITPVVLPALKPLLAAHPGLDVEILNATATVNLQRHDADLALRLSRPEQGNLRMRKLAEIGFGLYAPAEGRLPSRHVLWPDDISVATLRGWAMAFGAMDGARLAVNTLSAQIAAVRDGMGIAVLPHFLARPAGLRLLAATLPDGGVMSRPVLLVTHADLAASRRVMVVADAMAEALTARRHELEIP